MRVRGGTLPRLRFPTPRFTFAPTMSSELEAQEGLVRIRVPLDRGPEAPGPDHEWVWGEPLGSERFRIETCPLFAYGLSRDDVVHAAEDEDAPRLEHVVEKGGHRTLRVALDPGVGMTSPEIQGLLERLLDLGCTHESLPPKILALDVPPEVELASVAELLQALARDGILVWEWADPRPS